MLGAPLPASALEPGGGISVGAILAGAKPRLVVSPQASLSWKAESGFLFTVRDVCSILPAINEHGAGVHNSASASLGYASGKGQLSVGPSIAFYSMPVCNREDCARVGGVAPGAHAQADWYFAGPFGLSVSASVEWMGGRSDVLPGGVAVMAVAGPILRWRME